ncbi:MAG TPA: hypothetical protein DCS24_06605, partial [Erythrobacter sp.]|nr:hypothetical protein [Erythrobacter sp.]
MRPCSASSIWQADCRNMRGSMMSWSCGWLMGRIILASIILAQSRGAITPTRHYTPMTLSWWGIRRTEGAWITSCNLHLSFPPQLSLSIARPGRGKLEAMDDYYKSAADRMSQNGQAYLEEEGFHLDLERYWIEARSIQWWLVAILAGGLLLGLIVTLLTTELYRASARLEITQVAANVTDIDPLENASAVSELQYLNTQYELLESRFMAARVAEAGNLTRSEEFIEAFGLEEEASLTSQDIEEVLLENVSIEPITQSSLVDVRFSSSSPRLSTSLTNLWAQEFIAANYEKRFGANIEARGFLQEQIAELRERLAISEKELVDYANANEILVLDSVGAVSGSDTASQSLIATDLTAINAELAQATADRISAEAGLVSGEFPTFDPRNQLRAELIVAESELAMLRANFGPKYPALLEKEARVKSLRASIEQEAAAYFNAASVRESELRAELEKAKRRFLGQQDQGIQYGILKREVDTNRELYEALLQRFKELEASGAGQNNIKLIDLAELPDKPYAPSLIINMLVAFVGSLVAGAGLVYLRVTLSQTLRDPQDVKRKLGLPLLGAIPKGATEDLAGEILQRTSEISEAYKAVRTNLTFLTPTGAPEVLMITSSVPSEGKSISAAALASSFAQLGKHTLLIDADLRNSKHLKTFGLSEEQRFGLSTLLTSSDTDLSQTVIRIDALGIDFMPTGYKPPNPVELIASDRFNQIIEMARQNYDQVLIDGAPMLSLADAVELSRAVDGVIYVIESDRIKLRGIENALDRLRKTGAQVYGGIVTKLDEHNSAYGYGYG